MVKFKYFPFEANEMNQTVPDEDVVWQIKGALAPQTKSVTLYG